MLDLKAKLDPDSPAETADRTLSLISLLSSRNLESSNLCFFFANSSRSTSAMRLDPDADEGPASGEADDSAALMPS